MLNHNSQATSDEPSTGIELSGAKLKQKLRQYFDTSNLGIGYKPLLV